MSEQNQPYSFHPIIDYAYKNTLKKINTTAKFNGHMALSRADIRNALDEPSYPNAALVFRALFPSHHFKVLHTLQSVIGIERLTNAISTSPNVCIIDIGCGTGAASAGMVSSLLTLFDLGQLTQSINLHCIAIDPDDYSLDIYIKMMKELQKLLSSKKNRDSYPISLSFDIKPYGIPNATEEIKVLLSNKQSEWQQPRLGLVHLFQVNVVRPLAATFESDLEKEKRLGDVIQSGPITSEFGQIETRNYRSILEGAYIDNMQIITIGTNEYMLPERVQDMGRAIENVFTERGHQVERETIPPQNISFYNPPGSLWSPADSATLYSPLAPFHLDLAIIQNSDFRSDKQWRAITDLDNLQLAFFRVRQQMLRETFIDEVEMRLFESDLSGNLSRLRQQLIAYTQLIDPKEILAYGIPKNSDKTRPKALSRIEEEILSVAVIQTIGQEFSSRWERSYAYRIAGKDRGRDTEYLYENWWDAYQRYIKESQEAALSMPSPCILRTDVSKFFERVAQDRLLELIDERLTPSQRVIWLLRLLLYKDIPDNELRQGLIQGGIGSGFYANIYLTPIDALFGTSNTWGARIFRYVDDIVVVVPDCSDLTEIREAIGSELGKLGLELSLDKTEEYDNAAKFTASTEPDISLNQVHQAYERALSKLWIVDPNLRRYLKEAYGESDLWWYRLEQYRQCLVELGLYVTLPDLSRRVYRYLYNDDRRKRELGEDSELSLPDLPDVGVKENKKWAREFRQSNPEWQDSITELRQQLIELFKSSYNELPTVQDDPMRDRQLQRRIRFAVNKFAYLGLSEICPELILLLRESPWRVREPIHIIEDLARQGFAKEITDLLEFYRTSDLSDYMRAICIRALRFLPRLILLDWDYLSDIAVNGSLVEMLMATETWLYRERNAADSPVRDDHLQKVLNRLRESEPISPRLKKNYLLIVGLYAQSRGLKIDDLLSSTIDNDPLIANATRTLNDERLIELFEFDEPDVIRHNYYSGRRPYQTGWQPSL